MHRTRQTEARCIAVSRLFLDLRPARITETKQLRGLVEGFADRVVLCGAKPNVVADAAHSHNLGVTTGSEEQTIRKCRAVGQPRRQCVRFEVIDGDQRLVFDQARSPWRWSGRQ